MALIYDNRPYKTRIQECLADDFKVAAIKKAQDVFYDKRNTVVADVPEWLDFRAEAAEIRDHVLNHLDYYVNQFAENAEKAGSKVHFAFDDKEATQIALDILRQREAKMIVKSKTILTEEIGLNEVLEEAGIEVNEN